MKAMRWSTLLLLTLLVGCNMSGCGRGIFNKEPFVDAKKDAQGRSILLDTPRMWAEFTETVDMRVASEMRGGKPPGVRTWNEHWVDQIKTLDDGGQENALKYISYIIESRRRAGLPELEQ
ncbi:MAG: hypothetical protein QM612_07920 [Thermomonas sp.]|uniref:hypothetical protein n=1 Tax=Thermomonas sp. TaxID=1971895 RepID=UPI0039E22079